MKFFILFYFILFSTSVWAQYQKQDKSFALQGCEKRAMALPEEDRQMVLDVCRCTVEATDYESLNKSLESGALDLTKVVSEAAENLRICEARSKKNAPN